MRAIILSVVGALILANVITTYRVSSSHLFDRSQKVLQVLLIWSVPLFGMLISLYFLGDTDGTQKEGVADSNRLIDIVTLSFLFRRAREDNGEDSGISEFDTSDGGDSGDGD